MIRSSINKANAQHSTGPTTEAGKHRSSLNALRHGLTGQVVVMPNEDMEAYHRHLNSFTDQYRPEGATEANLVQALADATWRLNRAAAYETNLIALAPDPLNLAETLAKQSKNLSNISIHTQRLWRQIDQAIVRLQQVQETRRAQEQSELDDVLEIIEMYKSKGQIYIPANDGFVFTKPQIDAAIQARTRQRLVQKARAHNQSAA
jgi:hypothetical protein